MRDKEVERIARMLKAAVQFCEVSHRQVERSMGLSTGYLSRIFSGKVELRVQHVLGVCHAIGLPVEAFFEAAYPRRDSGLGTARLVAALQELMPQPDEEIPRKPKAPATPKSPLPVRKRTSAGAKPRRSPVRSPTRQLRWMLEAVLAEMDQEEEMPWFDDDLPVDDEP